MRLIDADVLVKHKVTGEIGNLSGDFVPGFAIANAPTIEAEPVRHDGNATFITTESVEALDAYRSRIIVGSGRWCRVFYEECSEEGAEMDEGG